MFPLRMMGTMLCERRMELKNLQRIFPSSVVGPMVLLSISIPLALLACVTTSLSFGILCVRAAVVYVDVGLALANSWIYPDESLTQPLPLPQQWSGQSSSSTTTSSPPRATVDSVQRGQHSRNRSGGSGGDGSQSSNRSDSKGKNNSQSTFATPPELSTYDITSTHKSLSKSESFASLLGTAEATRDFESLGGWRSPDEDPQNEALWTGLNSRLSLPLAKPERRRHHRRSLSSQSQILARNRDTFRMSPATSRARTPSASTDERKVYFDLHSPWPR